MDTVISSGSQLFDQLLNGGYETNVITTVYGPAGSGKSTLSLLAAIAMAKTGKKVISGENYLNNSSKKKLIK